MAVTAFTRSRQGDSIGWFTLKRNGLAGDVGVHLSAAHPRPVHQTRPPRPDHHHPDQTSQTRPKKEGRKEGSKRSRILGILQRSRSPLLHALCLPYNRVSVILFFSLCDRPTHTHIDVLDSFLRFRGCVLDSEPERETACGHKNTLYEFVLVVRSLPGL